MRTRAFPRSRRIRVTILGAGVAIPAKGRSPAGICVQVAGERILLDAGPGTLHRLHAAGVAPLELDRIFLSHYHLDHCLDLATTLFALRIPQPARTRPLAVYGLPGLKRLYRGLNTLFSGWLAPRSYRLSLREIRGRGRLRFDGWSMHTRPMRHSAPSIGFRLEAAGRSVVYSGDTDNCDELVELGQAADLLILECSARDERKVSGHLTPSECGRIAAATSCRRLVLTHFYPVFRGYDVEGRVRRAFRGPLIIARDFTRLTV
ncbi:MAG: MBL fold metallo-hydrolase [Candidatus Omnitrophica bacterium]|nr:MBL fold metallo-hydrolase [Candidatus Omnitrophota bacterium]